MDNTYNGWSNYETWCCNLWLTNDEGGCEWLEESATEALEEAEGDKTEAALTLSDQIKEMFGESMPELGASFWSDMISAAFGAIDFYEIAKSALEDIELEVEEPDEDEDAGS